MVTMKKFLLVFCMGVMAALLLALPAAAETTQSGAQHQNEQKRHTMYSKWSGERRVPAQLTNVATASHRSNGAGEVVDEHGVIIEPAEGESKTYERSGQGMYGEDNGDGMFLAFEAQDGTIEVVECADGTVYFKDLIYAFRRGYWVKGTKNGNTITIAANQTLAYSKEYNASVLLRWAHGVGDGTIEADNTHGDSFTFTIGDDGSLTLEGTTEFKYMGENYFMGTFWSDNSEFATYGDALTVYKPVNIVTQVDELPYMNDFSTLGDQKAFTIVDGNEDSSTWFAFDGKYSLFASYDNNSDDWLISPAIKLEAGKNYHVAFDTWKNSEECEKTIELKMGKTASTGGLTQDAIPATTVETLNATTLENGRLTVAETGYYYFGIHDISEAGGYSVYVDNFVIEEGADDKAPAGITDLTVTQDADVLKATISFTAPAKAFNGSDLTTNLTKIEVLRDGMVIKTLTDVAPGSAQSTTDEVENIGRHTYSAVAYNENGKGQKGTTFTLFFTQAQDIPYIVDFTDQSIMDVLNIIDANGDGTTWEWNGFQNALIYPGSYNADGDDYLVVMPVKAEAGNNYKVTFTAHTEYAAERFEVLAGRQGTPEALTISVIPATAFQADEPTAFEGSFTATESGLYFVAIRCISDMYSYDLFADKLVIEKGAEATAPMAVSDLTVVAGEQGAKQATISFTAPVKAVNGSDLTENLTKIELLCGGEVVAAKENVVPGATVGMTATVETPGYYTYQVLAYNAAGAGIVSNGVKVWIGQDAPGSFYGVQAVDNGTSVDFSWNMVTEGANGNYLNPDDVEYQILATEFNGWGYDYTDVLGSVKGADHYSLEFNTDEGQQQLTSWGVKPVNETGEGYPVGVSLLTGAPYALPYKEPVENGVLASLWEVDSNGALYVVSDASNSEDYSMALTTTWFTGEHAITSGKMALRNAEKPVLTFDVRGNGITTLLVKGAQAGGEPVLLQEVTLTEQWNTVEVALDHIKDARYVRLTFAAEFNNASTEDWMNGEITSWGDAVFFDNIQVAADSAVGISNIQKGQETQEDCLFNLSGQRVSNSQKGVKIVRMSDGTTRKVVVK
jgi:hypothetical protein